MVNSLPRSHNLATKVPNTRLWMLSSSWLGNLKTPLTNSAGHLPGLSVVFQNNKVRPYSTRGLGKNQDNTELEFTFLIAVTVSEDAR